MTILFCVQTSPLLCLQFTWYTGAEKKACCSGVPGPEQLSPMRNQSEGQSFSESGCGIGQDIQAQKRQRVQINNRQINKSTGHRNRFDKISSPFAILSITILELTLENCENRYINSLLRKPVEKMTHPVTHKNLRLLRDSHIHCHRNVVLLRI